MRPGRVYAGKKAWRLPYRRWLTTLRFDHPVQQVVLQDYIHSVHDAEERIARLMKQIEDLGSNFGPWRPSLRRSKQCAAWPPWRLSTSRRKLAISHASIVEADLWDRSHLDLCGPATLTITAQGGDIALGALEAGLEVEYARDSIGFRWTGCEEGEEVEGEGTADGALEIEFEYRNGDEAVIKAKRMTSSTTC